MLTVKQQRRAGLYLYDDKGTPRAMLGVSNDGRCWLCATRMADPHLADREQRRIVAAPVGRQWQDPRRAGCGQRRRAGMAYYTGTA